MVLHKDRVNKVSKKVWWPLSLTAGGDSKFCGGSPKLAKSKIGWFEQKIVF